MTIRSGKGDAYREVALNALVRAVLEEWTSPDEPRSPCEDFGMVAEIAGHVRMRRCRYNSASTTDRQVAMKGAQPNTPETVNGARVTPMAANCGLRMIGVWWRGGNLGRVTGCGEPNWQPISLLATIASLSDEGLRDAVNGESLAWRDVCDRERLTRAQCDEGHAAAGRAV